MNKTPIRIAVVQGLNSKALFNCIYILIAYLYFLYCKINKYLTKIERYRKRKTGQNIKSYKVT